ncbi:thiamine phosphate synthase [Methanobrevibacter sp.]|uniref:thiamine phosphate synthase n=1 Tax=Methanobrevibacter sp. TaxID=66852 RepID=UPI0026DFB370|nr:thiamine phosphate synthase [Methanobrevibacter sp.]MDO5824557.1 thiamine phosphate synthase [Methanobrevibacter sp.]
MKDIDLSLYLVTDKSDDVDRFLNTIEEAIKGGVSVVQIREKTAETLDFYNLALRVKEITAKYNIPLIINDRVDVALAIDAEGVHVGQSDMPCDITRKLIGKDKILGVSAATIGEAQKAQKDGADYIGTGALFPTATKDDAPSITKQDLKEIAESIDIPVVAIGGITLDNASELTDTGIAGLSVVSAIMSAENPKESSQKLLNIFNKKIEK